MEAFFIVILFLIYFSIQFYMIYSLYNYIFGICNHLIIFQNEDCSLLNLRLINLHSHLHLIFVNLIDLLLNLRLLLLIIIRFIHLFILLWIFIFILVLLLRIFMLQNKFLDIMQRNSILCWSIDLGQLRLPVGWVNIIYRGGILGLCIYP